MSILSELVCEQDTDLSVTSTAVSVKLFAVKLLKKMSSRNVCLKWRKSDL